LEIHSTALNKNETEDGNRRLYFAAIEYGVELPKKSQKPRKPKISKYPNKKAVEQELARRKKVGLENHTTALYKKVAEDGDPTLYLKAKEHAVDLPKKSKSSSPIKNADKVGGIDLNPVHLNLQIKRDGSGVPLPLNLQPIETMQINGFVPIIINITPVLSMPLLSSVVNRVPNRKTTQEDDHHPSPMAYLDEKLNARKNTLASRLDKRLFNPN